MGPNCKSVNDGNKPSGLTDVGGVSSACGTSATFAAACKRHCGLVRPLSEPSPPVCIPVRCCGQQMHHELKPILPLWCLGSSKLDMTSHLSVLCSPYMMLGALTATCNTLSHAGNLSSALAHNGSCQSRRKEIPTKNYADPVSCQVRCPARGLPNKSSVKYDHKREAEMIITWHPTWEAADLILASPDFKEHVQSFEQSYTEIVPFLDQHLPAADTNVDNLTRQGCGYRLQATGKKKASSQNG
eukprot:1160429-Pelagomonas_calceolata.AAC.26